MCRELQSPAFGDVSDSPAGRGEHAASKHLVKLDPVDIITIDALRFVERIEAYPAAVAVGIAAASLSGCGEEKPPGIRQGDDRRLQSGVHGMSADEGGKVQRLCFGQGRRHKNG